MPDVLIAAIAVPLKLARTFDYLLPPNCPALAPGCRVRVRFSGRLTIGWVVETRRDSELPIAKLKAVDAVVDQEPLLPDELWRLLDWTHRYYHHPLGEVLATALPGPLKQRDQLAIDRPQAITLTAAGRQVTEKQVKRSPRQAELLALLASGPVALTTLRPQFDAAVVRRLRDKGWIETVVAEATPCVAQSGPTLNEDQQKAVSTIGQSIDRFAAHLLDGVTGSGKTEVYLHAIAPVIENGQQVLVIVPEIALTPQLLERFSARLGCEVATLHSGQSDGDRVQVWLRSRAGELPVVIGTRSAIFVPLSKPGLIVVDEEHDLSLKQQDGLRYSARDLAVQRARLNDIPVVLGSATPSLESLNNALNDRYRHLLLPKRPGTAKPPKVELLDLRAQQTNEGIAAPLRQRIDEHLRRGEQVLLFLNRRGFAPVLICDACGWYAECSRCDARMTWHRRDRRLRCHHCDNERPVPRDCPQCGSSRLGPVGAGTERLDQALRDWFADYPILRLDRDTTRNKGQLSTIREQLKTGQPCVVVGTQMLAKGHDFPNVTLVGIVDIDQALFSSDFRAAERAAQLLVQVAGRAGRAEKAGTVILQTHHPHHPLFLEVLSAGYGSYARQLLRERHAAGFPPYGFMTLLRAEAHDAKKVDSFLTAAASRLHDNAHRTQVFGPIPAPMERRAGRYRMQLLLLNRQRSALMKTLQSWVPGLYDDKSASRVRWSLDIDPQESF